MSIRVRGDAWNTVQGSRISRLWPGVEVSAARSQKDRTYDGIVAELVLIGHMPFKIGLGHFKDREAGDNRFTYWFVGWGW